MKEKSILGGIKACGYDIKRESDQKRFESEFAEAKKKVDFIQNIAFFDDFMAMPNYNALLRRCKKAQESKEHLFIMTVYIHGLKDFISLSPEESLRVRKTIDSVKAEAKKLGLRPSDVFFGYGYIHIASKSENTVKDLFKSLTEKYQGDHNVNKKYCEFKKAKGKENKSLLKAIRMNIAKIRERDQNEAEAEKKTDAEPAEAKTDAKETEQKPLVSEGPSKAQADQTQPVAKEKPEKAINDPAQPQKPEEAKEKKQTKKEKEAVDGEKQSK
jgi:hypothetical protein